MHASTGQFQGLIVHESVTIAGLTLVSWAMTLNHEKNLRKRQLTGAET
tara:strand:+ start:109 stop:252 length:144 start_codon:yes stop_codon:yes gene_type:complete